MTKEDALKINLENIKNEYQVSHNNICRKINNIFAQEIQHFNLLLSTFNDQYQCINSDEINLIVDEIKDIFNSCKCIVLDDYENNFIISKEKISIKLYDLYMKKVNNSNYKIRNKEINDLLNQMCKFDYFLLEDRLEDSLIEFSNRFSYRYLNSDEQNKDFMHLVKSVKYSLICELKNAIFLSIDEKQEITSRFNSANKNILSDSSYRK